MFYILLVTFCFLVTIVTAQWDYCQQICGNKTSHTLCKYPRAGPGPRCTGYIHTRMSDEEKARIVARLNHRRNQAAVGNLLAFPKAANMLKLRWVDDLADSAQRWADQCMPPSSPDLRDECRDLYVASAGQTIATIIGDAPGLRVEALVDTWYMQSLLYSGNVTLFWTPPNDKTFYGDFTQMMWAKSYMVGCGRVKFLTRRNGKYTGVDRLVCNFAPRGNLRSRPVWMPGKPCARCPANTGCYADYPGLCHYRTTAKEDGKNNVTSDSEDFSDFIRDHLNDDSSKQETRLANRPNTYDMILKSVFEHTNTTKIENITFEYSDNIEHFIRDKLIKILQIERNFISLTEISTTTESSKVVNDTKIVSVFVTEYGETASKYNETEGKVTEPTVAVNVTTDFTKGYSHAENLNDINTLKLAIIVDKNQDTTAMHLPTNITSILEITDTPAIKRILRKITPLGRPTPYELDDLILRQSIYLNPKRYFSNRRPNYYRWTKTTKQIYDETKDLSGYVLTNVTKRYQNAAETQSEDLIKAIEGNVTKIDEQVDVFQNLLKFLDSDENVTVTTLRIITVPTIEINETSTRLSETQEDLQMVVERAQRSRASQPAHLKVRRELRERHLDALSRTTLPPPVTASLPPLLKSLVHYFPFLKYEMKSAASLHYLSGVLSFVPIVLIVK